MKLLALILPTFLLTTFSVFGQVDCDTTKYPKLLSNSYQCKWNFFQLNDTIEGVIIKHEKQMIGCGFLATASLTIIETGSDTIRILDLCNLKDYSVGQKVKILPESEPKFQTLIPCYFYTVRIKLYKGDKGKKVKQDEKAVWHSNDFDERILKTTWGQIINE